MVNKKRFRWMLACFFLLFTLIINYAFAASDSGEHNYALTFIWMAVLLLAAKISALVEKFGQPPVLGELVMGVVLGNLMLLGIPVFEPIKSDLFISFLAQLGVVILLFQIGLESTIYEMRKVGLRAFLVALVGVIVPFFTATWIIGPLLLPGLQFNSYLFLGATLTATSVSITARVFKDLGKLDTAEAKIVLGAAVIDDVMGLVILAVVSAIVSSGSVGIATVGLITLKAVVFFVGAIFLGSLFAPHLGRLFSRIHTGTGMKLTLAISFGLITAYLAQLVGLAPIVGAFAAGLVLDPVHFRNFKDPEIVDDIKKHIKDIKPSAKRRISAIIQKHAERHVQDLVEPIGLLLVPLFFVTTGIAVDISALFNIKILFVALGITIVAVLGKIVAGLAAGKVKKSLVGWGMVPRGEVGLIFAAMGRAMGVVTSEIYSIVVIVIIMTTLITPPILAYLLRKAK